MMYFVITNKFKQVKLFAQCKVFTNWVYDNCGYNLITKTGSILTALSDEHVIEEWTSEQVHSYIAEENEDMLDPGEMTTRTSDRWTGNDWTNLQERGYKQYGALLTMKGTDRVRNDVGSAYQPGTAGPSEMPSKSCLS